MFRVIVAGGRDFSDYQLMKNTLDHLLSNKQHDEILVVCGGARGADLLGEKYALEKGYAIQHFLPDWEAFGKVAGFKRNVQMAENADALVAFWDGESHGTKHMIETAINHGLQVRVKRY